MLLQDIVLISQEMVRFAKKDRWDEVQSKEVQRQAMLAKFFSNFSPDNIEQEEELLLKQVSDINTELLNMAQSVKQEFITVAADAINTTKAVQKYKKHSKI